MSFLIIYLTKSELIKRLFKCRTEILEKLSNCGASRGQSSEEMNILWPFGEGCTTFDQVCCEYHCSRGSGGRANAEKKPNVISTFFNHLIQNILITWSEQLDKKRSLAISELANFFVLLLSAWQKIANAGTATLFLLPVCLIYVVGVYCLITFFNSFALYFPIHGCSFNCLFWSFICGAVLFC